ncbi:hypothetical protein BV133_744 [Blastochloris viridis]|uniref:Uncharacterized protein n=1 Tax=Blastochloris viridis TaxID=1079 RepID=A0A182D029_BLAVI|nr:hypothetical protein BV133_744 [Blastochloris viridis]
MTARSRRWPGRFGAPVRALLQPSRRLITDCVLARRMLAPVGRSRRQRQR